MKEYFEIKAKELTPERKAILKHINNMIIEHKQVFQEEPEELLISKKDFRTLTNNNDAKYALIGKVKIYSI